MKKKCFILKKAGRGKGSFSHKSFKEGIENERKLVLFNALFVNTCRLSIKNQEIALI